MSEPDKTSNSVSSAWWRWPAISLLFLAWVVIATVAFLTGGVAKGAHWAAEACLDAIDELRS